MNGIKVLTESSTATKESTKKDDSSNNKGKYMREKNYFHSSRNIIKISDSKIDLNKCLLEDTLLHQEKSLPLFISFDVNGLPNFPKYEYKEEKNIKEDFSFIEVDFQELKKAKKKQRNNIAALSAYAKSVFLKKDLSEVEETKEENLITFRKEI